jgi:hypothetical protein
MSRSGSTLRQGRRTTFPVIRPNSFVSWLVTPAVMVRLLEWSPPQSSVAPAERAGSVGPSKRSRPDPRGSAPKVVSVSSAAENTSRGGEQTRPGRLFLLRTYVPGARSLARRGRTAVPYQEDQGFDEADIVFPRRAAGPASRWGVNVDCSVDVRECGRGADRRDPTRTTKAAWMSTTCSSCPRTGAPVPRSSQVLSEGG